MNPPIPIALAVEDDLSEWVLRRLLNERGSTYAVGPIFKRGGFGPLKKQVGAFNNMAKASPVLLLTDLDQAHCAPSLIADWLGQPKHKDFLFRVAVREVEAWLLACDEELSRFLGLRKVTRVPSPELLPDPKATLLKAAASSPRRDIREALVRDGHGNLKQGPAYNSTLNEFVADFWNSKKAVGKCPSLKRLTMALDELEWDWKKR